MPDQTSLFDPPDVARPPRLSAELRGVLAAALPFVSRNEPIPHSVFDLRARAGLIARRVELREGMKPGDAAKIGQVLMTFVDMRGGFRPASAEQANYLDRLRAVDLSEVPFWALAEAARAYRRGEIGTGITRPTAGQLRKLAEDRAAPLFTEMRDIERVLESPTAPEPTEEDRARKKALAHRMRELAATLTQSAGGGGASHVRR